MKLRVDRFAADVESTLGALYIDDKFECYTLEDQEQLGPKVEKETRIPAGTYKVTLRTEGGKHAEYGNEYKRRAGFHKGMLWLRNVPGFEYILIHCGNNDDHSEGCILVGKGIGRGSPHTVAASRLAYEAMYPKVRDRIAAGEEVTIEINNYPKTPVPGLREGRWRTGAAGAGVVAVGGGTAIVGAGGQRTEKAQPKAETPAAAPTPAPAPVPAPVPSAPPSGGTLPTPTVAPTPTVGPTPTAEAPPAPGATIAPSPAGWWPASSQTLNTVLVAFGVIAVLLGLYILLYRYRDYRRRRGH